MKKIILLSLFICLKLTLFSQLTLAKFYFTIDAKQKHDVYKITKKAMFLENIPIPKSDYAWTSLEQWNSLIYTYGIGYNINKNNAIEILRSKEQYHCGFALDFLGGQIYSPNLENSINYMLRYNYKFGVDKLKVIISPAYIFSISLPYKYGYLLDGINTYTILQPHRNITFQTTEIRYQDYGLSQYFHSIDAKVRVEYTPWKWLSVFYGGGYTYGFNTLAYHNVKYTIDGFPEQHAINELNGTNYYSTFGLRLSRTKKFDKEKAKRMLRIAFLPHPKHKPNATKKNIP